MAQIFLNNDTVMITEYGGYAIKFTAGENLVKGNIVDIHSDGKVWKCIQGVPDVIGVSYENVSANGSVWIVLNGIAEVYFIGNTTAGHLARGFVAADAGYVAGQGLSEDVPTSPFATDKHFFELGHVLETRVGAGLAKVVLHYN
jgi:hypothetical protein